METDFLTKLSDRDISFLFRKVKFDRRFASLDFKNLYNANEKRKALNEVCSEHNGFIDYLNTLISEVYAEGYVEDEWFNLLRDNKRALVYFADDFLAQFPRSEFNHWNRSSLNYYDHVISCLDCCKLNNSEKKGYLKTFIENWERIKAPNKYISWINPKDVEQLEWIYKYLCKKDIHLVYQTHFKSYNEEELYYIVLTYFDKIYNQDSGRSYYYQWEDFSRRIKKAWEVQKFRMNNKNRRRVDVQVSKKAYAALKEMAKYEKLSKGAFIDELILQELMRRDSYPDYRWKQKKSRYKYFSLEYSPTGIWTSYQQNTGEYSVNRTEINQPKKN